MKKNYFLFIALLIAMVGHAQTPIITAIVDGDCSGGVPKLVEIYAQGTVDFSNYSIQKQSNANNGEESWASTGSLSEFGTVTNDFVYVYYGSEEIFNAEFPSATTYISSDAVNNNGDDRVRIINSENTVIDQYGVSDVDGSGEDWEYSDSYAVRINGTSPNAGIFSSADWTFGGVAALDGLGSCNGQINFETAMNGIGVYESTPSTTPSLSSSFSVEDLDYYVGYGPSESDVLSVSGANLTDNIVVTAPADFEVSLNAESGFASTVTLTPTEGTISATDIYVRLAAGLVAGEYTGNITVATIGATNVTTAVSGTVSPATPQTTIYEDLATFSYTVNEGPSAVDYFDVEAMFLNEDLVITATENFEISLSEDADYASSLTLTQIDGDVATTTVYIRMISGLSTGEYTGTITATSLGAENMTIDLEGNVYDAVTNAMIITGVYDGPLTGGYPKGVELYAFQDIEDLSLFGISSANNGGGSTAGDIEFIFPSESVTAGTFIYVTVNIEGFTTFFEITPSHIYASNAVNINGNDAIELYENGTIIDTFGDVDVDGTGEAWDYLDGWVYRNNNTLPDGTNFTIDNWYFSGTNALDGESLNSTAVTPFPIGTFQGTMSNDKFTSAAFNLYPNPVTNGILNISSNFNGAMNVQIFNLLGRQVVNQNTNGTLNISALKTGVYLVKVTQNGVTATQKLVIK